jgi:hypothetical protein
MAFGLRHAAREMRREAQELFLGATRSAAARRHARRGDGERAILSQAQAIRFARPYRESMASYRRLNALLARFGDCGAGFSLDARSPERFVAFIGYSRSGHSLVGSLIDAHPDATIAHELHALKHLSQDHEFDEVVRALRQNSRIFQVMGRSYTGYDYVVPDQWQGASRRLRVIGDKKGNGSARLLRRDPQALSRILAKTDVPVSFIHVIRNPYDNIATKALRTGRSLEQAASVYFANAQAIADLKASGTATVHDVHLDTLIDDPKTVLRRLVGDLGLDPEEPGYLDACAGLLFASPSRSRDRVDWPRELIGHLDKQLASFSFLKDYAGGFDARANISAK